jgi:hypothetical protein
MVGVGVYVGAVVGVDFVVGIDVGVVVSVELQPPIIKIAKTRSGIGHFFISVTSQREDTTPEAAGQ